MLTSESKPPNAKRAMNQFRAWPGDADSSRPIPDVQTSSTPIDDHNNPIRFAFRDGRGLLVPSSVMIPPYANTKLYRAPGAIASSVRCMAANLLQHLCPNRLRQHADEGTDLAEIIASFAGCQCDGCDRLRSLIDRTFPLTDPALSELRPGTTVEPVDIRADLLFCRGPITSQIGQDCAVELIAQLHFSSHCRVCHDAIIRSESYISHKS